MIRPVAFADTECFPNYWLLKIRPPGGPCLSFRLRPGEYFTPAQSAAIASLFTTFSVITFNGNHYDIPMIIAAMSGMQPDQLKVVNDRIIVHQVKPWELGLREWKPADHIDLIEVCPGTGSQKLYAGRVHYRTMRDLPYDPSTVLTLDQMNTVDEYCENDLGQLEAIYESLRPQLEQRELLSERYGIDLRSKSDAQLAETVIKVRCERALGTRIYKSEIDWNMRFHFRKPDFIQFQLPQLCAALEKIQMATFSLGSGVVQLPPELEGLEIVIGTSIYKLGIGGLHSQEKRTVHFSDEAFVLRDNDVASYYPSLILNSGEFPAALGSLFRHEYAAIKAERLTAKALQAELKKKGDTSSPEYQRARVDNEGGKIMINGTFGKTGSHYSILFAPSMMIQTTISGQLSLLMLIEWHELNGIAVVSANTDGIIVKCPRDRVHVSEALIAEWQSRTNLEMETSEYRAVYSRDINNYIAIKADGSVKRKGEYGPTEAGPTAYLNEKRNPGYEVCADAVADYLAKGIPMPATIYACQDLRKFVVVQNVSGGAVKMWGDGPRKDELVRNIEPQLIAKGWIKTGRSWSFRDDFEQYNARDAWEKSFPPRIPEFLGKVARWYYSDNAPGPIVYHKNGNLVGSSYDAKPCMTWPDQFPTDVNYGWYIDKAYSMLDDLGVKR